ncbi:3-oxoacyl-ACP synthase III family protein [Legionella spiritensis]|uniref:3-oxoacyl-ACP synthase n=1 Tax=Legionella spiritensis TaxID=452 RepID=A0A0W0ZBP1_LEGSP|nr:beta-ketoacyl-ACP synthase III [Legionella spiritensis]KTD66291.1 3-oxoacyl-ACP synthase [Legionella spiritensis]SNV48504.1 3-oxoacyl-ACP synthase [Legionella spiritensis]VEG91502.1 3-oxoacyl-ACP synthase [Legionella spiritensis]
MSIKISGIGSFLPAGTLNNADFEEVLDTTDEWITQMTGIKERHISGEEDDYLDCCYQAACAAINQADVHAQNIDLIIIGTSTPYQLMPSTAVMLQQKLAIERCISFDIQAACSGFIYALANAFYLMQANPRIHCALVLGCDAFFNLTDPLDRTTRILFGDGFGAFLLTRNDHHKEKGIFYCDIGADGYGKNALEIPWGVAKGFSALTTQKPYIVMNGRQVFKNAIDQFVTNIQNALKETHLTIDDLQQIITHQANIRIINAVASALDIPVEKFHVTLDRHGNTSAASIPLAFDDLLHQGKINRGELILLTAFGAGYTWGTIIFEF